MYLTVNVITQPCYDLRLVLRNTVDRLLRKHASRRIAQKTIVFDRQLNALAVQSTKKVENLVHYHLPYPCRYRLAVAVSPLHWTLGVVFVAG
jgi:hypothetical protein